MTGPEKRKHNMGYVLIKSSGHHRAYNKYVLEHIVIMEVK